MYTTLISSADLARHLGDPNWRIIDTRSSLTDAGAGRRAYGEGHIPGAVYAHLNEDLSGPIIKGETGRHPLPDVERLARTFSRWGIERGRTQVVVYDDAAGAYAVRLWWLLRWLGHEWVAVLDGGLPLWTREGGPVTTEIADPPETRFEPEPRRDVFVDVDFVDRVRSDEHYVVLDARAPERFRGEVEPIDPVAGHIPGALNAFHAGNIGPDGRFLPAEMLRERFRSLLGDHDAAHTVCYCGSGVTACHNIFAMVHAGLGEAKLYPGSWSEWIVDPDRQVGKDNTADQNT